MSLYARIMSRGEYPYRVRVMPPPEPVRLVSPVPPHEPEPHQDEPFAPVYDHVPLEPFEGWAASWPDPYGPDPVVFGSDPRVKGDTEWIG